MRTALRALAAVVAIVVLLAGGGAIFQSVATENDLEAFPPPGRLVAVNGHLLHIDCTGSGAPTVILEHAAASNSASWALVQPQVAAVTRVCAYDRAGFGWSDKGAGPADATAAGAELAALLDAAGVPGPYVLVGHDYGAFVARVFAELRPQDVAGMVLADPGRPFDHPLVPVEMNFRWKSEDATLLDVAPVAARLGLMRLATADDETELPAPAAAAYSALNHTNAYWDTMAAVAAAMPETSAKILDLVTPAMPLTVLSAGSPADDDDRRVWTLLNATLAGTAPRGEHRVVAGATSGDLLLRRDGAAATAAAVMEMVERLRGGG